MVKKMARNLMKGQSLIEALIMIGMLAIVLPALLTGLVASRSGKAQQLQRVTAISLLKEAQEAVWSVRNQGWINLPTTDGIYHPAQSGSTWSLVAGDETVNGFTRSINFTTVYRDTNGNIVTNGGTADPSTKKVVITISWVLPYSSNISSTLYLTRHENAVYTETTAAQFNLGTRVNTYVTNTQGGEVVLGAGGGGGDWCIPSLQRNIVDLSGQGVSSAVSVIEPSPAAGSVHIFMGTGANASGPTFSKAVAPGDPPTVQLGANYNNYKANGIYGEQNYGYIASTDNSAEVTILDLNQFSDPPTNSHFLKVGWFDAPNQPGSPPGNSVYVAGNVGYMTAGKYFYTFDLSSKTNSRARLNTSADLVLDNTGTKIIVVGRYAYVAVASTTKQLQVIDVLDPAHPSIVAQANVGNGQAGVDVAVNQTGTKAYLVTTQSATQKEFFVIDTSSHSGSLPVVADYETNGMDPTGVTVVTGNRAVIVGINGTYQYQVVNVNFTSPTPPSIVTLSSCGTGLQVAGGINGVSSILKSDGYAYSYIVTNQAHAELQIILGGAGGQYVSNGTYESAPFDPNLGHATAFNRVSATVSQPGQTTIQMRVAVANKVSNSCTNASYTYLGPNGDPNQYFNVDQTGIAITGAIPLVTSGSYVNPGYCFRYKVWFSTNDNTASPELYDVNVYYSP